MLSARSVASAAMPIGFSTGGIPSHPLLRRSDEAKDQMVNECKKTCTQKDCDRFCLKQLQAKIQLQADIMTCGKTCIKEGNSMDECRPKCVAEATGVSEENLARMEKIEETTNSCPKTEAGKSDECMAEALGISKKLFDTVYDCVDKECLSAPDKQFAKCYFECSMPMLDAAEGKKDGKDTPKKDDKKADGSSTSSGSSDSSAKGNQNSSNKDAAADKEVTPKGSGALRHHSASPTIMSVVKSMAIASLVLNLITLA